MNFTKLQVNAQNTERRVYDHTHTHVCNALPKTKKHRKHSFIRVFPHASHIFFGYSSAQEIKRIVMGN